jgi:hypothetical protein
MRYRRIDLMEIHHYKLIITPLVYFWALNHPKTSKIAMDPLIKLQLLYTILKFITMQCRAPTKI